MAEVGEEIIWQTSDVHDEVYRVGYGHELERVVEGLTEQEWLEREFNDSYADLALVLDAHVEKGTLDPADRDWRLQQAETNLRNKAAMLFGAPADELTEYARAWYGPQS